MTGSLLRHTVLCLHNSEIDKNSYHPLVVFKQTSLRRANSSKQWRPKQCHVYLTATTVITKIPGRIYMCLCVCVLLKITKRKNSILLVHTHYYLAGYHWPNCPKEPRRRKRPFYTKPIVNFNTSNDVFFEVWRIWRQTRTRRQCPTNDKLKYTQMKNCRMCEWSS